VSKTVCYCFGYTVSDIEDDFTKNGKSTILDKIIEAKKFGECNCAKNHPQGI